jgi:hypothetical protein
MMGVLGPQRVAAAATKHCGQQCGDGHRHATTQHLRLFSAFAPNRRFQLVTQHSNVHCLPSHPVPDNAQGLVLENYRKI